MLQSFSFRENNPYFYLFDKSIYECGNFKKDLFYKPNSNGGYNLDTSFMLNDSQPLNNSTTDYNGVVSNVISNNSVQDENETDLVKMFVGQVPKTMDQEQLRSLFEIYGPVHSINILRDKATGLSRGCCFVTFYGKDAAWNAQLDLHNNKTLTGMHHPIQMKLADCVNRNERKLFVGMLTKKFNENDVRQLFSGHGTIEECTVLRDQSGQSKGCAFVTFSTKQAAIGAIKDLHQSQTMEGCSAPLVVKFADTQKEKEQKKIQQMQASIWNLSSGLTAPLTQSAAAMTSPIIPNQSQQTSPFLAADAISPASLQLLQQLQAVGLQQQLLQEYKRNSIDCANESAADNCNAFYYIGLGGQTDPASAAAQMLAPMSVQNLVTLASMTQPSLTSAPPKVPHISNSVQSLCILGKTPETGSGAENLAALPSPYVTAAAAAFAAPLSNPTLTAAANAVAGKQIEGPEGCNLFIYHLPQEFTDIDLASTFMPFGNVVSAKVFIDKQTNLSKCFGFVSYDNAASAQTAIQAMHGFQIGTKRLKVQLKRSKDASKPY